MSKRSGRKREGGGGKEEVQGGARGVRENEEERVREENEKERLRKGREGGSTAKVERLLEKGKIEMNEGE